MSTERSSVGPLSAAVAAALPTTATAADAATADALLTALRDPGIATALGVGIGVGALLAVLLRRKTAAAAPTTTDTDTDLPNRPLGQWTGLCHALSVRTGARLVCIHISDDGLECALKAAWQATGDTHATLNFTLPPPSNETRVYNADRAPLPSVTQIAASGAVAGVSVPVLSPSRRPVGWLSAFFDHVELDPGGQAAAHETAALVGALHHLASTPTVNVPPGLATGLSCVPAAVALRDEHGNLLESNDSFRILFADCDDEDQTQLDGIEEDASLLPSALEALYTAEHEVRRRSTAVVRALAIEQNGRRINCCFLGSPLFHDGRITGYASVVLDTGLDTDSLSALPTSQEQRALQTLRAIGEAVISLDTDGGIRHLNPAAERLIGLELADAIDRPFVDACALRDASTGEPFDLHSYLKRAVPSVQVDCVLEAASAPATGSDPATPARAAMDLSTTQQSARRVHLTLSSVLDRGGTPIGAAVTLSDITLQHRITNQLMHQATHDPVTALINRQQFISTLEAALRTVQTEGHDQVLVQIDLDDFKLINDGVGHFAGDALLAQLTPLIQRHIQPDDVLGRLGGDEFGLLLMHTDIVRAKAVADRITSELSAFKFEWSGKRYDVRASIGLTPVLADVPSAMELMQRADVACQTAKDSPHWDVFIYGSGDSEPARKHGTMQMVNVLHHALEHDGFCLFAQPIIALDASVRARGTQHYELLLRMLDPNGQAVSPGRFLGAAERYGLTSKIDRWVIENALALAGNTFHEHGYEFGVNLSGSSLSDPTLLDFISREMNRYDFQNNCLCFEITETEAIVDLDVARHVILSLRDRGCRFALDDFGSGLSSFTYLKHLPVDYLKIDGSFVKDMVSNPVDQSIVEQIHLVGKRLGLPTVAEFVEDRDTLHMIRKLGIDYAQGHLFAKPKAIETVFASSTTSP
ncbi:MAG: EAL domain-containing protein [Pseudomonadota bacterium]